MVQKTGSTLFSGGGHAASRYQHRKTSIFGRDLPLTSYLMYTIDVFLCQSDKEKHMRIGEILISPILKLLSRIRWITS